jgi:SAM-dependent methyltransferase
MQPSFYGRLMTHAYDIGANPPEIMALYLALWEAYGRPQPVLEPMCGTGLNLIPFLQAGAQCDGMDNSPFMLERCRRHLAAAGLTCTVYEQDITTCHVEQRYRFIFIPGGSFGLMTNTGHAQTALRQLAQALEPGGWLVFDVRTPAQIRTFGAHGQVDHRLQSYPDGSTIFSTGLWEHLEGGQIIRQWVK